ncbi:hypothetical protein AAG906_019483 [Vitis piasezkii]
MYHIRILLAAIPPRCITSGILLRRHSTRMSHIRNSSPQTFHPDFSHPALDAGWERRLDADGKRGPTPDERGGRFNFLGWTYPDHLIAPTRRVSQPFCMVAEVKYRHLLAFHIYFCSLVILLSSQSNSEDFSSEDERLGFSSLGVKKAGCTCHVEYEIADEVMNFMSYVAEV